MSRLLQLFRAECQRLTRTGKYVTTVCHCVAAAALSLGIACPTALIAGVQIPTPNTGTYLAADGDFNAAPLFENFGTIVVDSSGFPNSQQGITVSNKQAGNFANVNGILLIQSGIPQQVPALFRNTDVNTVLNNLLGGNISINGLQSQLINQNRALLQNGVPELTTDSATSLATNNGAILTNTDVGTLLVNRSGATLRNDGLSRLVNRSGAVLANAFSGSQLINTGGSILTNTDSGTVLVNDFGAALINTGPAGPFLATPSQIRNQNGATLYNQNGAKLINENGAMLINESGAILFNSSSIVNTSKIVNSDGGKFVVCGSVCGAANIGTVTGSGTYTQTDPGSITNVIAGGSIQQSSIIITGGKLGGGGVINSSILPILGAGVVVSNGAIINPGLSPSDPNTLTLIDISVNHDNR